MKPISNLYPLSPKGRRMYIVEKIPIDKSENLGLSNAAIDQGLVF